MKCLLLLGIYIVKVGARGVTVSQIFQDLLIGTLGTGIIVPRTFINFVLFPTRTLLIPDRTLIKFGPRGSKLSVFFF